MPTKTELMQLQKLYKTDEKIGERVGGAPAQLVAYWRRKKGIPKYSLPKFSEAEIRRLWEQYGDDEKAGLELSISKPAFYNWRRRYGLKEKPAFLKLEQLEFQFPGIKTTPGAGSLYGHRTMLQKIIARAADKPSVEIGDTVIVQPDMAVCGGEVAGVMAAFKQIGSEFIWKPARVAIVDQILSRENIKQVLSAQKQLREFVKRQQIKEWFETTQGVPSQVLLESGMVLPGNWVATTLDTPAALGSSAALVWPVTIDQMASIWAKGSFSCTVPQVVKLSIGGKRPRQIFAIDIALHALKQIGFQTLKETAIELSGAQVSQLSFAERLTLCAFLQELGSTTIIAPYDAVTRRFVTNRHGMRLQPVLPDKDADYQAVYQLQVDHYQPMVMTVAATPTIRPLADLDGTPAHVVIIGGAAGGRYEDLRYAAEVLKGRTISEECRLFIIPDSQQVYLEALKKGLLRVFLEAGGAVLQPGEDHVASGLMAVGEGEKAVCSLSLSDARRLPTEKAEVFIVSSAVAAASAVSGQLTDAERFLR